MRRASARRRAAPPPVRARPPTPTATPAYRRGVGRGPTLPIVGGPGRGRAVGARAWTGRGGPVRGGRDYLTAADGAEMRRHLGALLADPARAREIGASGRRTVLARL